MRGKEVQGLLQDLVGGITPAYAGKSLWCAQGQAQERDHPRVCEEKNFLLLMTSRRSGSPPRVRGKVPNAPMISASARITPACAGKSLDDILYLPQLRDHPRVCGEKWLEVQKTMLEMESPPRVRGKGEECGEVHFQTGITPACAGKSCG